MISSRYGVTILHYINEHLKLNVYFDSKPGPSFIELLKQKILLSNWLLNRNKQDTSHKLYLWHDSLAGNLILISSILLCLVTSSA